MVLRPDHHELTSGRPAPAHDEPLWARQRTGKAADDHLRRRVVLDLQPVPTAWSIRVRGGFDQQPFDTDGGQAVEPLHRLIAVARLQPDHQRGGAWDVREQLLERRPPVGQGPSPEILTASLSRSKIT